jgi:hypothetical protein
MGICGGMVGAPELFLLRSLLLSADKCPPGWPIPAAWIDDEEPVERNCGGLLGLLEVTVGLNVTVRCGFGGIGLLEVEL